MFPISSGNPKMEESNKTTSDEELVCICCTEPLTIQNIVNTKCNHQVCSDCYYKWAGDHNSCVFCRQKLYEGSRHEEYVKLGRDIRRRMGVVDELREEREYLESQTSRLALRCTSRMIEADQLEKEIIDKKRELYVREKEIVKADAFVDQIKLWRKNPKKAIEMWEREMKILEENARVEVLGTLRNEVFKEMNDKWMRDSNFSEILIQASRVTDKIIDEDSSEEEEDDYCLNGLFQTNEGHPLISALDAMNEAEEGRGGFASSSSDEEEIPDTSPEQFESTRQSPNVLAIHGRINDNQMSLSFDNNFITSRLNDIQLAHLIRTVLDQQRRHRGADQHIEFDIMAERIINTQSSVNRIEDENEFNPAELHGGYAHGHG
jgi:hypothetical protein